MANPAAIVRNVVQWMARPANNIPAKTTRFFAHWRGRSAMNQSRNGEGLGAAEGIRGTEIGVCVLLTTTVTFPEGLPSLRAGRLQLYCNADHAFPSKAGMASERFVHHHVHARGQLLVEFVEMVDQSASFAMVHCEECDGAIAADGVCLIHGPTRPRWWEFYLCTN